MKQAAVVVFEGNWKYFLFSNLRRLLLLQQTITIHNETISNNAKTTHAINTQVNNISSFPDEEFDELSVPLVITADDVMITFFELFMEFCKSVLFVVLPNPWPPSVVCIGTVKDGLTV